MRKTISIGILTLAAALWHVPARATQLTFEQIRDSNGIVVPAGNGGLVPQDYGDRVTGLTQAVPGGTFSYGNLGEGFTPNVVVSYGPVQTSPQVWNSSYGNLTHIIWPSQRFVLEIVLTADPGFTVRLHDFHLAGWPQKDYTINSIEVLDGANNLLFSQNNAYVEGDSNGPGHSQFDIDRQATSLILRIDSLNLGEDYDNIGLDNLRFSQSGRPGDPTVPEPASFLLLGAGLAGFLLSRRRKN